jgi:hypothetical protein
VAPTSSATAPPIQSRALILHPASKKSKPTSTGEEPDWEFDYREITVHERELKNTYQRIDQAVYQVHKNVLAAYPLIEVVSPYYPHYLYMRPSDVLRIPSLERVLKIDSKICGLLATVFSTMSISVSRSGQKASLPSYLYR